jgi:hypothetical protein
MALLTRRTARITGAAGSGLALAGCSKILSADKLTAGGDFGGKGGYWEDRGYEWCAGI